jgi:hypothetical protein
MFADIAQQLLDPLLRFQVIAVTLVYGIMLLLGYVALCGLRLSIHVPNGHPGAHRSGQAPGAKHLS